MSDADKIDMVMAWAEEHPRFDTSFVESLSEQLDEHGELTDGQVDALDNIIQRWGIHD